MAIAHRPQVFLDRKFRDIFSFVEALQGLDMEFHQLDSGRLRAQATVIAGSQGGAFHCELDRGFHQLGSAPPEFLTFGFPDRQVRWCGVEAGGGDVLNFNLPSGFEGVSSPGFSGRVFLLSKDLLFEIGYDLGLDLAFESIYSAATWEATGDVTVAKRRFATMIAATRRSGTLGARGDLLIREAAAIVARLLANDASTFESTSSPLSRRTAMMASLELLNDQRQLPLKVADLCRVTGVSGPTLHRAFHDEFGISPKKYLTARSLSGARGELLAADEGTAIHEIASRWCFWHMGQFAKDYRQKFDELPSETQTRAG